jgi:hypothetical protein
VTPANGYILPASQEQITINGQQNGTVAFTWESTIEIDEKEHGGTQTLTMACSD